ncbi:hypothetical protein QYF36_025473 [Acer negundo]|nr:hypothetical protein QYF36_025473 [Acer negundo]
MCATDAKCGTYNTWIVRRRTLVLQLHKTEDGSQEYAEFLHLPRRKFTDFVVNLTLIDLPCLTKVDVEGQAETIVQDIENMVRSYVEKLDLMDKGTNALDVDIIGVGCYSSKDLWTWRNEGIVLAAKETNETHDLYKLNVLERPKVVYNEKTGNKQPHSFDSRDMTIFKDDDSFHPMFINVCRWRIVPCFGTLLDLEFNVEEF